MLTDSARHFLTRVTTANLAQILWFLSFAVKEELFSSYPHEFYCPASLMAKWFEDEVNDLILDQKLDLIKEVCDQIKANRK